ncbi:MAG: hypothetical protein Nkreftii_002157 [Candidatus Nitrospira kreftii]|uniref:Uncharacterized protein n=1 Tax=Candidatus Nitrospira kreftii TaxID=2652173 RepID=A0A7S8IZK9_9BACT|nr:MAG: hypothetical protein Nkreftii_002157 [Candidatus Nitrospira kreftii]
MNSGMGLGDANCSVRLFFGSLLLVFCDGCTLISDFTRQHSTETGVRQCSAPPEQVELRKIPLTVFEHRRSDRLARESTGRMPTSFSWRAIQTAQVIDVLSLLNQFEILEERSINSASDALRLQAVHQEILSRVILAMLEVSSAVAKTTCEIERSSQVVDRLRVVENDQIRRQTLLAIIVGAAAAVASGGLAIADISGVGEGIVSIIGGTVAGALGVSALYHETEESFRHPDNILREIWEDTEDPVYLPPSIWRFLRRPMREGESPRTYRDETVAGWRKEGRLGDEGSELEATRAQLFFGDGGVYTTNDLQRRTQMLDSLRATVLLLNQDLEHLVRELMIQSSLSKPLRKRPVRG